MTIKANMSIQGSGKLLAFGDVVIDDQIFLHQVKVIEGNEGLIVSLPKKKMSTGAWVDVVELPPELYQELKNKVIEAVRTALAPDQRYMVTLYPVVRYGQVVLQDDSRIPGQDSAAEEPLEPRDGPLPRPFFLFG